MMNETASIRSRNGWGNIFVISGPSGAGKTSLCRALLDLMPEIVCSISCTTRPPREGEQEGKDYYFVDSSTFDEMVSQGAFLEWAEVHGHKYGTLERHIKDRDRNRDLLLEVDCKGALLIKEKLPDPVLVFIMPPSILDLVTRILKRGRISEEDLMRRMTTARDEIQRSDRYDYLLVNQEFPQTLAQLQSIIVAERCRRMLRLGAWQDTWMREIANLQSR